MTLGRFEGECAPAKRRLRTSRYLASNKAFNSVYKEREAATTLGLVSNEADLLPLKYGGLGEPHGAVSSAPRRMMASTGLARRSQRSDAPLRDPRGLVTLGCFHIPRAGCVDVPRWRKVHWVRAVR